MTGTIVNTVAVLAGGGIGLLVGRGLKENLRQAVTQMLGIATGVIGVMGLITTMVTVNPETGALSSSGELMLLIYLAVGAALGTAMKIEDKLDGLGGRLEKKLGAGNISQGFVSASLLFCSGAMTIVGSLNDGLMGDSSVLFIKSGLDFTAAIVLASTLGPGVLLSAVTVLVYQGALTLGASLLAPVLQGDVLGQICMVGYAIVLCIAINFFDVVKIKTGNLLPALLGPIVYNVLALLKTLW